MSDIIRPLTRKPASTAKPVAAYDEASGRPVFAYDMDRSPGGDYDLRGYKGTKEIVCIDCKIFYEAMVPLILKGGEKNIKHFAHPQGMAPGGKGVHGETAEHVQGKHLVAEWARSQSSLVRVVEEEIRQQDGSLRTDVLLTLVDGRNVAFEVQRKELDKENWNRRHGGYKDKEIKDVWFWSPNVMRPQWSEDPMGSIVLDVENEELGILVTPLKHAKRNDLKHAQLNTLLGYSHPTQLVEPSNLTPSHYASAPIAEWSLDADGSPVPPVHLQKYIDLTVHAAYDPERSDLRIDEWDERRKIPSGHGNIFRSSTGRKPTTTEVIPHHGSVIHDAYHNWLHTTERGRKELVDMQIRLDALSADWARRGI